MVVVFLAIWGAIHGQGPFVKASPMESALAVQLFLALLAVPLLLLAAVLRERERATLEHRRMEREAEEQRMRVTHLARVAILGELTGALTHELNQPLTAILANAQATQRMLDAPAVDLAEVREILRDIVADDKRAAEVIRRLRALLKRGETQSQPIDVNSLVREALGLAHGDLARRGIVTAVQLAEGLAPVRGDRVQLEQVLLNIVMNACDEMAANPPGNRHLTITTEEHPRGRVRISIADSGPGIDPPRLESLFEPFFTTKMHGLGLGLSVSRSIVAAHGGRIGAENRPGGGALFLVELPSSRRVPEPGPRGIGAIDA
jgi:C4-dicarboxylate-specific signal transduction histidine kinase